MKIDKELLAKIVIIIIIFGLGNVIGFIIGQESFASALREQGVCNLCSLIE